MSPALLAVVLSQSFRSASFTGYGTSTETKKVIGSSAPGCSSGDTIGWSSFTRMPSVRSAVRISASFCKGFGSFPYSTASTRIPGSWSIFEQSVSRAV